MQILSLALSVNVWVYASLMGVSYYSVDDLTGNVYAAVVSIDENTLPGFPLTLGCTDSLIIFSVWW